MDLIVKVTFDDLLAQIERIPSEWLNTVGRDVVEATPRIVEELERKGVSRGTIETLLRKEKYSLDVFRLMLGLSQDEMVNELLYFARVPDLPMQFSSIRNSVSLHCSVLAEVLIDGLGLKEVASKELFHEWKYSEVLVERYKYQRGRAIKGQKRGRSLEADVEDMLKEKGVKFEKGRNFVSRRETEAKADFSVPSHFHPDLVIEVIWILE